MKNNTFNKAKRVKARRKKWYIINTKRFSCYIWALPLVPFVALYDKISQWADSRRVWDTERASRVLDRVMPKVVEWVEEDNAYYYCMEWGTSNLWRCAKHSDRKWARKHQYALRDYIKEGYENNNYTKTVEKDYYDTWVKFVERV